MVQQYLEHSKAILSSEDSRFKMNERRGLGRIYILGYLNKYDLSQGFPLLTTKRVGFKTVAHELIWFLNGDTNIKNLADNNVHIWDYDAFNYNQDLMVREGIFNEKFQKGTNGWYRDVEEYSSRIKEDAEFAARWGDLGPVYGSQWMHWPKYVAIDLRAEGVDQQLYIKDPQGIDQIANVIEGMRKNLTSARHIVTAWNPNEVESMALPPCHCMFQLNSDGEQLDLMLTQRACDMFLGVPFNIASYAMLTTILARELELKPGYFVHSFGDVHFYTGAGERAKWYRNNLQELKSLVRKATTTDDYKLVKEFVESRIPPEEKESEDLHAFRTEGLDHVTGILEQLTREPKQLPRVRIADKPYNKLTIDDFFIEGYNPHPYIKRTLAV